MRSVFPKLKNKTITLVILSACYFTAYNATIAAEKWYKAYANGQKAMEESDWQTAIDYFKIALTQKSKDKSKTRAYGTVFIQYYPNRELGICFYHLGDLDKSVTLLQISMNQAPTDRAREYLKKVSLNLTRGDKSLPSPPVTVRAMPNPPQLETRNLKPDTQPNPIKVPEASRIGDRLSIAILPFEANGIGRDLGEIDLLDKLTTVFHNLDRFKVVERAQLETILEEQKLGMAGVVDASTAAQIGKGIGVDAVVCGSITVAGNSASIDARLIDTETAAIISAQDAFISGINLSSLTQMISNVAEKVKGDMPILSGYVISVDNDQLTLDLGRTLGIRKGMKCHIYREGEPIVHPITNEIVGKKIEELCEVQLEDVFDSYSVATITKNKNGLPQVRDRVTSK